VGHRPSRSEWVTLPCHSAGQPGSPRLEVLLILIYILIDIMILHRILHRYVSCDDSNFL